MKHTTWTLKQFLDFKKEYEFTVKAEHVSFWFEHDEFLTAYAKYLIEYLEPQFKKE